MIQTIQPVCKQAELIGANLETIKLAEDRDLFRQAMSEIGLESPRADIAHSLEEALEKQQSIGFPTIIRPSFTMGGSGGGIAYNRDEFEDIVLGGIDDDDINGMSGGWQRSFTLDAATDILLSLRYNLTQSSEYESDEYSEVLVSENRTCDVGHYRAVPHQLVSHVKQTIFCIALSLPEESSCCAT